MKVLRDNFLIILGALSLITIGLLLLLSIAPFLFPQYYLYLFIAVVGFLVFSQLDFDILSMFSKYFYILSCIFLLLPVLIGQITRGTTRWLYFGTETIQPSELTRPFLLLFFANYLAHTKENKLTLRKFVKGFVLFLVPEFLIFAQPSLGVAILTAIGFFGILLSLNYNKKIIIVYLLVGAFLLPFAWFFLAPYQKERIIVLVDPASDPYGVGYNSIQSMITVGSGKFFGRGLGGGVQTQLLFLPEKHTDFIFASVAEEFGFVGTLVLILTLFFLLFRIIVLLENAKSRTSRAFISGAFLSFLAQSVVHIGMNMGLFPITGVPFPLVSAGGSSLLATMILLGMLVEART